MRSIDPGTLSIKERHGLLLGAIGPRPIAWVSTVNENGSPNLAPFSFFNVFSSNPPILIFSPARSGRTNTTKHTWNNVLRHPEVVVNIVDESLLDRMVISSLEYPEGVSEFEKAGLKTLDSDLVSPPRVQDAPVQFECKVIDTKALGTEGAAGNLVICEVIRMHYAEHILDEDGRVEQESLKLVGRMGGAWYSRAYGESLFQVHSNPMDTVVGYGSLPEFIKNSKSMSAADLHQLIQIAQLPDETEVNDFKLEELSEIFMDHQDTPEELKLGLMDKAKLELGAGRVKEAWMCILSYNP